MCLYTIQTKTRIAKKDIHVYKVLRQFKGSYINGLLSPFQDFPYDVGELVTANIGELNQNGFRLRGNVRKTLTTDIVYEVEEGLHSYLNLHKAQELIAKKFEMTGIVFDAIIPKGSEYICSYNGEITSNQLIVLKEHQF